MTTELPLPEPSAYIYEYENGEKEVRFSNKAYGLKQTPLYTADQLRAAIAADRAQRVGLVPIGWKLVPEEPTPEMLAAYLVANTTYWHKADELPKKTGVWRTGTPSDATKFGYTAMLAATPPAPTQTPPATAQTQEPGV